MENAIFLELKRRGAEIFYFQDRNSECLLNACKKFDLKEGWIISYDEDSELVIDDIKIKVLPIHKFLIN